MGNDMAGSTLKDFPKEFRGPRFYPNDSGFVAARRIFNMLRADENPALIARAMDADDVVHVMRYASDKGIPVAVRSGGHGVDGSAMPGGALVLDMSALKQLRTDPDTRVCRVESGVLLRELDAETQRHSFVVPSGTVSTTGVAGLTLGGGVGYNMRRFGATVDNLLSCDVVTADGRKVRASAEENPDLFWALRGGGGNFGVVTSFELQGHGIGPQVFCGAIVFPAEQLGDMLAQLREHMVTAPRELAVIAAATACPPFPPVPARTHGRPVAILVVVYTGVAAKAQGVIDGLSGLGEPLATFVGPSTWTQANCMLDAIAPFGRRVQTRGGYLSRLGDRVISAVARNLLDAPAPTAPLPSTVQNLWCLGGAINEDFAEDSVAFSREGALWFWEAVGQWDGDSRDAIYKAWADRALADVAQDLRSNGYVNLTMDMGPKWLRGLYGSESKYKRLLSAKKRWDPENLLRFNKNFRT
jgi:FAD/FMN-containing dehydrogenase